MAVKRWKKLKNFWVIGWSNCIDSEIIVCVGKDWGELDLRIGN